MACRKLAFRTVEQAETTQRLISVAKGKHAVPLRLYECPDCGLLHWTSKPEGRASSTVAIVESQPTCSSPGCPGIVTAHCEDCGAPICAAHVVVRGAALRARRTCGRCLSTPDLALAPPPPPPPPVASGTFAKLCVTAEERAARHRERMEAQRVEKQAKAAAKAERRRFHEEHAAAARARDRAATADVAWFKDRCREITSLILQGQAEDARHLADACCSVPKTMNPSADSDETRRFLERFVAEKRAYLAGLSPSGRAR